MAVDWPDRDLEQVAKGWAVAMFYSRERLKRVNSWDGERLEQAVKEGHLVLETVCLFVHSCIKRGQYR